MYLADSFSSMVRFMFALGTALSCSNAAFSQHDSLFSNRFISYSKPNDAKKMVTGSKYLLGKPDKPIRHL